MEKEAKKTWEIKLSKYIGWEKTGMKFVGARPYRSGKWLKAEDLPTEVFDYCHLVKTNNKWVVNAKVKETYLIKKINMKKEIIPLVDVDIMELEKNLKELNEGRNLDCWPLCSFGWKDADLDAEGCTGIEKIVGIDGKSVVVEIGGHKTFCDPATDCEYELSDDDITLYGDMAQEIVSNLACSGEWTEDDWSLFYRNEIKVPVIKTNGKIDYLKLAERIIKAAKKDLEAVQNEWKMGDEQMDELYAEMKGKYENN